VLWHKASTAYALVRVVRLLQARGSLPGHPGLEVRGVHVHHYAHGLALLALQQAVGRWSGTCVHAPRRANVLCTGLALIADEYDVVVGGEGKRWAVPVRVALDGVGVLGAALGAADLRETWSGWYRDPVRAAHVRPSTSCASSSAEEPDAQPTLSTGQPARS